MQLSSVLAGYVSSAALDLRLAGYVQSSSMTRYARTADLAAYATLDGLASTLRGYIRADGVGEYGFVTQAALSTALSAYVTQTALETVLSTSYLSQASAASTYATKDELADYVPLTSLEDVVAGRVFRMKQDGEYPTLNLDTILQSYLTLAVAAETYVTPAWLRTNGYVTQAALETALASYVAGTALSDALEPYVTLEAADGRYLKQEDYEAPPDLPTGIMGAVFRSPTSPGVYPERNLDVVLQAYLTKTEAATAYVTKSYLEGLGYASPSDIESLLSPYVTATGLASALTSYLTLTAAASTYVTPQYLVDNGFLRSGEPNGYVSRTPTVVDGVTVYPELNLDAVLAAWPVSTIGAQESRPVSASTLYAAFGQRDTSISNLQSQINNLSITGGASHVMRVVWVDAATVTANDRACNTFQVGEDAESTLTVELPSAYSGGSVARDFLVVLDFPSTAGTGQVPLQFLGFVPPSGQAAEFFSYSASGLYSLAGVVYGMKVVYALTELLPGAFAVTRKNLYEV